MPDHLWELKNAINKTVRELELTGAVTIKKVADKLDKSSKQIKIAQESFRNIASLDMMIGTEEDTPLESFLQSDYNPQEYLEQLGNQQIVQELLKLLESKPRYREAIILRYGLNDGSEMSLQQVGDQFGLTRERVRQIQDKCLNIFRGNIRQFLGKIELLPDKKFKPYVKPKPVLPALPLSEPVPIEGLQELNNNTITMIDQQTSELFTEIENFTQNIEFLPNQEPLELNDNDNYEEYELSDQVSCYDTRNHYESNHIQLSLFPENKPNLDDLIKDMQKLTYSQKIILLRAITDELAKQKNYD